MKRYRRNSRKNPWRNTNKIRQYDKKKIMAAVLVISLPIAVIALVTNLVLRLPDIYEYSLSSSNILKNTTLAVSKDDVKKVISEYLQGKTGELKLVENTEYKPEDIFSKEDKAAMHSLKIFLNVILGIGILFFIVTAVICFFMMRWRVKGVFMEGYKRSLWVFAILQALNVIIALMEPLWKNIYGLFMLTKFSDGDKMVMILGDAFPRQVAMFQLIIGGVIMALVGYLTWSVAGRKKLFKERWSD